MSESESCIYLMNLFINLMNLYTEIYYPSNIRHYSRQNVALILLWSFNLKRKTIFGGIFMKGRINEMKI